MSAQTAMQPNTSYPRNIKFAEAAKRVRKRIMQNLLERFPDGDFFDNYAYKTYLRHLLVFCTEIGEFKRVKGEGMPTFFFATKSETHCAALDLYATFITWIGGGMSFGSRDRGIVWENESKPCNDRYAEVDVVEELVWLYCTITDKTYFSVWAAKEDGL